MKKAYLAAIAHLTVIMVIIALCGQAAPVTSTPAPPPAQSGTQGGERVLEENVTIRVLENQTAIKQGYFDILLNAFNEAYKEQGITAIDANMDEYLDLENDGPYGYGPDVLYQANDMLMKYTAGGHLLPLSPESFKCNEQTNERAWGAYLGADGQYYGVPVNVQAPVLYYRKDLLPDNEAEYDKNADGVPDMIESWGALYRYSKELKQASGGAKFGYMKSLFDVYFSSGYLFSYGGYLFGDNETNAKDIGFANGNAELGASVVRQLASVMNEDCIDDTITKNVYSKMASGEYFCTMTTPDVYTMFITELTLVYKNEGLSEAEARAKAIENIVFAPIPLLPENGDLSDENAKLMPTKVMGGINGYAISAYTKAPNACAEFIDFATSFEMLLTRAEVLGISPARIDAAEKAGGLSPTVNKMLASGDVVIMPSIREIAQIWTPLGTYFADVAKDPFRPENEAKYTTNEALKDGLSKSAQQVYDAIWTLGG